MADASASATAAPPTEPSDASTEPTEALSTAVPASIQKTVASIPLLTVNAGPRDGDRWVARLREELAALVAFVKMNKSSDSDWFRLQPGNAQGTKWAGQVWYVHEFKRYEFNLEFEIPATYPHTAPELSLPELDGKTAKMYRGGKICLTVHFKPLWSKNVPRFGIAHALALGMAPWLAAEVPALVDAGKITHVDAGAGAGSGSKSAASGAPTKP